MKKIIIALVALGAIFTGCKPKGETVSEKGKEKEVFRIAVEGYWKPYNFTDENGELTGYDIDVIKAINEKIPDVTIKVEPTDWDGMLLALENGHYDIVVNQIKKSPARAERYLFADKPYNFDYPAIAFTTKTDIKTAEDLIGKTVIVGAGSSYADWIDAFNEKTGGKITVLYAGSGSTTLSIFADVISGRADATIDSPVAVEILKNEQNFPLNSIPADPDLLTPTYFVYGKSKRGEHVKAIFDKALEEIRADGTLSKLAIKWFGTDTSSKGKI